MNYELAHYQLSMYLLAETPQGGVEQNNMPCLVLQSHAKFHDAWHRRPIGACTLVYLCIILISASSSHVHLTSLSFRDLVRYCAYCSLVSSLTRFSFCWGPSPGMSEQHAVSDTQLAMIPTQQLGLTHGSQPVACSSGLVRSLSEGIRWLLGLKGLLFFPGLLGRTLACVHLAFHIF